MNISKSINIALAEREILKKELAEGIGVTPVAISNICSSRTCSGKMLIKLADFFDMKVSEFVALGE